MTVSSYILSRQQCNSVRRFSTRPTTASNEAHDTWWGLQCGSSPREWKKPFRIVLSFSCGHTRVVSFVDNNRIRKHVSWLAVGEPNVRKAFLCGIQTVRDTLSLELLLHLLQEEWSVPFYKNDVLGSFCEWPTIVPLFFYQASGNVLATTRTRRDSISSCTSALTVVHR